MELGTWTSFVDVVKNFLGNRRAENFKKFEEKLLKSLQDVDANMSIKINFLHCHLDKFPDSCGDVRDMQGERFHQDIKTMEERYQGQRDKRMMANFRCSIKRDLNNTER